MVKRAEKQLWQYISFYLHLSKYTLMHMRACNNTNSITLISMHITCVLLTKLVLLAQQTCPLKVDT